MNRFKFLFAFAAALFGLLFLIDNVYVNVIVFFFGMMLFMYLWMYIEENMNEKELRFFNKFISKF